MKRKCISAFFLSAALFLAGCTTPPANETVSKSGIFFDTVIKIEISGLKDSSVMDHCFDFCEKYENKFSKEIETSEISKINAAMGSPVEVSAETADLIRKGLYYSELSDGAFDITIAPVSSLWDFTDQTKTVPSGEAIQEALTHVGYQNVNVTGNTVTLADPKAALDLGGIAKGYIADQLKTYLKKEGVSHAIINLGGNVLTIGSQPNGSDYKIGLQKPFDEQNTAITTVSVHDQSVVSSGIYQRYFESDGKLYHHILNPKTGYPYENNLLGVTIISDLSADGDALSTTCFALGLDKGMELIKSLDNTEAIFITNDYELHYSNK